jgi:hypothetical protein
MLLHVFMTNSLVFHDKYRRYSTIIAVQISIGSLAKFVDIGSLKVSYGFGYYGNTKSRNTLLTGILKTSVRHVTGTGSGLLGESPEWLFRYLLLL